MAELSSPGQPQPKPQIDLDALAREIVALLKEELRREAERGGKPAHGR